MARERAMREVPSDRRLWLQGFCAALIVCPYLIVLLLDYYVPGSDEVVQLEAAIRLAAGQGYTASQVIPRDLAIPTFAFVDGWPIGYSALIAGLLRTGVPLVASAKLVKLIAIVAALVAWLRFANPFLRDTGTRIVFCGALGFLVGVWGGWVIDLLVVGLFPVYSRLMLGLGPAPGPGRGVIRSAYRPLAAGALAGLAVLLKYSALPFVILGFMWIGWVNRRHPRTMIHTLALFGVPAAGIVGVLFGVNYLHTGGISSSTGAGIVMRMPGWQEWVLDAGKASLFDAPYVPMLAIRELYPLFDSMPSSVATGAASIAVMGALAVSVLVLLRRGPEERALGLWLVGAYVANVLFLGAAAGVYFRAGDWTPLMEGRFFIWLVPGMILCVLMAASRRGRGVDPRLRLRTALGVGAFALAFAASTGYAAYIARVAAAFRGDTEAISRTISEIEASTGHPSVAVFLDTENFRAFPRSGQSNVFFGPASWLNEADFSRLTVVAMVCTRVARLRSERGRNYCATDGFDETAARHRFTAVQVGARNTLYWRLFATGAAE